MFEYLVNKNGRHNSKGYNEVHKEGCVHYPTIHDYEVLGSFSSCAAAITEAKYRGYRANGCPICIPVCHKSTVVKL